MIDLKQILAIGNLGLRTAGYYAQKPLSERPGLERFHENYRDDHLTPIAPAERERLPALGACIACGLCEADCPALASLAAAPPAAAAAAAAAPVARPIRQTRGIPDYGALEPALAAIEGRCQSGCAGCTAPCTSVCPTGVPLPELVEFVRAHLEAMQR